MSSDVGQSAEIGARRHANYGDPKGWVETMWGALDGDGSMDWEPERHKAVATAVQYGLPLFKVTITYEPDAILGAQPEWTDCGQTPCITCDPRRSGEVGTPPAMPPGQRADS